MLITLISISSLRRYYRVKILGNVVSYYIFAFIFKYLITCFNPSGSMLDIKRERERRNVLFFFILNLTVYYRSFFFVFKNCIKHHSFFNL